MMELLAGLDRHDPDALERVADLLDKIQSDLRHQAHTARQRLADNRLDDIRREKYQRDLEAATHALSAALDAGQDFYFASERIAARYGWRGQRLRDFWTAFYRPKIKRYEAAQLEHEIMRLYRRGLTDIEIGKKVQRHDKTVAKIRRSVLAQNASP